ncbi:MAG: hypothetical protein IIC11_08170, partial [Proteobacteria bacterium]|nr:hypothetical protein [Pseudomonadota bacterium]
VSGNVDAVAETFHQLVWFVLVFVEIPKLLSSVVDHVQLRGMFIVVVAVKLYDPLTVSDAIGASIVSAFALNIVAKKTSAMINGNKTHFLFVSIEYITFFCFLML